MGELLLDTLLRIFKCMIPCKSKIWPGNQTKERIWLQDGFARSLTPGLAAALPRGPTPDREWQRKSQKTEIKIIL